MAKRIIDFGRKDYIEKITNLNTALVKYCS